MLCRTLQASSGRRNKYPEALMKLENLVMYPSPSQRVLRFVGDRLTFSLGQTGGEPLPEGWQAMLRTNLGRGEVLRQEIIHAHTGRLALRDASWRDIPMNLVDGVWRRDVCLAEAGFFRAKAYALDPQGRQHWPEGTDAGVCVHPDSCRTANTIYCAFTRMFGETRSSILRNAPLDHLLASLDKDGFTVIPPSGKLRDLTANCRTSSARSVAASYISCLCRPHLPLTRSLDGLAVLTRCRT